MAINELFIGAKVVTADPTTLVDGQTAPISVNRDQRLRVSTKPGVFDTVVGAANTVGASVVADVTDASNVMVHIKNTGTAAMAAGVVQFEGSLDSTDGIDGTWFPIQAVSSNGNVISTATPTLSIAAGAGYAYAWELSVNACRWFRVRCSTAVTASSIATVSIVRGSYATEPIPAVPTHAVTGSGTFTTTPQTGGSQYSLTTAAATNTAVVKSSAGCLYEISISNPTATAIFVKLYNKTTAPTVGTDIPILTISVPAGTEKVLEFGALGKRFATGIGIATTAAAAATDTAVAVAGVQIHGTFI